MFSLEEKLEQLGSLLRDAVDVAEELAREGEGIFSGQLEVYTIPWLKTWAEDEHQPGSVATLYRILQQDGK